PKDGKKFTQVALTYQQYITLCQYIKDTFRLSSAGQVEILTGCGCADNDQFYEARGKYTGLRTCNQWINKGLNKTGVRSALWTISDRGIFYQLDRRKQSNDRTALFSL
ncbi:MAG: DUF2459 domain-containing protein, partial [Saprospiraceae bacterium]